ncbi:MAG: TIGR03545 family protein [Spirochaetaceae bacterium]|nr:MAG: TIGR03545 family protein [Spirochaetaceae bacterium]
MKVPKLFKTEIKERRFQKKILGRIYIESERSFLLGLYSREADGRYRRSTELSDEEAKRLKQLARSIKKNRGVVRTGKLSLIIILAAALLVFNFGFKNRLLERTVERGLEAVFGARAEMDGLDFRVLAGRLSFDHLGVADREQPLRNLFELGASEVDLNTPELLKGKVVISNLQSREIRWHTPRQSSGALPGEEEAAEPAAVSERKGFSLNLGSLDAQALVDEQLARLSSPARITELNGQLRSLQERWQGTVEQGRKDVDELSGRIEAVRGIEVRSLDTVVELQQAVTDIQQAATALNRVREDLRAADAQIKSDRQEIAAAGQGFEQALDTDVAYLASLSDLSSGELRNLVSDLVAGYLQQSLGRYYGYAQRAKGYAEKLIARKREKPDAQRVNRMERGVDVPFPVAAYPRFLLENAVVSLRGDSKTVQGSLQNLSSNPDLIDRPLIFAFQQSEGEKSLAIDGALDSRSTRKHDLELRVQAAGYTVELSEGLEDLGLSSLSAGYRFRTDFILSRLDDTATGQGLLELYDLVLQPLPEQSRLGTVLYSTLGSLSTVDVTFDYAVAGGSLARVAARSSVDQQLARALEERFAEISAGYESRLREELRTRLGSQLQENEALSGSFAELVQDSDGNLREVAAYEAVLEQRRAEVEKRIADTQKQATDAVRSQLEKLPLPKLGF